LTAALPHAKALAGQYGLSVIPVDGNKKPIGKWADFQKRIMAPAEVDAAFSSADRMAIVCGHVSNDLEVIDFDGEGFYPRWKSLLTENGHADLLAKLVVCRTPSGGYHVLYRCQDIGRNQKLARVYAENGRPEVAIETRGEGGYVVAFPSAGYTMCQGKLSGIPTITPAEREALLHAARILDEVADEPLPQSPKPNDATGEAAALRPGDDYNARTSWADVLSPAGWRMVGHVGPRELWCRPGKDGRSTSATTGNGYGKDLLKVFSSNAHSRFGAFALINHHGDYARAAKALGAAGYGDQTRQATSTKPSEAGAVSSSTAKPSEAGTAAAGDQVVKRWVPVRYAELINRPPKPMLFDGLIGEGDNGMIFGLPKSGKTFVVTDLLMAAVCGGTFAGLFEAVRPLKVAYCTNEGLGSLHERLRAAQDFNEIPFTDIQERLFLFEDVPQLYTNEGAESIRQFAEDLDGEGLDLLVIDTLNKATLGADENSNSDAALVSQSLRYARKRLGCATLLVHHAGKMGDRVRGASAYDGDLDWQLKIERQGQTLNRRMGLVFAKDLDEFEDRAFTLARVNDSAAVQWNGSAEATEKADTLTQIVLLMRTQPTKEWWTLGQIRLLLPGVVSGTVWAACAREARKSDAQARLLDAGIDEGTRATVYRLASWGRK